jgi:ATP-dependent helicase/nuclease subunit B
MTERPAPRVLSIPPGVAFLPTLVQSLLSGELAPGFSFDADPLKLADATIYVPTRRAARALRGAFLDAGGGRAAILPSIRPLGEIDEDGDAFDLDAPADAELPPPIAPVERLLLLAPLVREWKKRLPAHVAALFSEEVVVPASTSDAIWLSRDLAALMDEIETEGADWSRLGGLADGNLANWWQVTLDFLEIVTAAWPKALAERDRSNPAAYRTARIRAETRRLRARPPSGPVIAAGSTGSIPATAELLAAIARLPSGAVVLPGFDPALDDRSWSAITAPEPPPSVLGHPQYGLARLLTKIGATRRDVVDIAMPTPALARRAALIGEAMRPAATTDAWSDARRISDETATGEALTGIALVEAASERDEAMAIAAALRIAVAEPGRTAALATSDRNLARRVASELRRFGIDADDSGGSPLLLSPPGTLLTLVLEAVFRPGDPVPILSLLKHPLLTAGLERTRARRAAQTVELVALRGGTGRPDVAEMAQTFDVRLAELPDRRHAPFWLERLTQARIDEARDLLGRVSAALAPLVALRGRDGIDIVDMARQSVLALEALARGPAGDVTALYAREAGEKLAEALREILACTVDFDIAADDWPDIATALLGPETVKPKPGGDGRVAIWGALEARLQSVDTLVLGGLNEGSWPRRAEADRFMSRMMKAGLDLEPPERRIGLAAHDFMMAMGRERVVLTRSARAGDAPAVASRWLQRLLTFVGPDHAEAMAARGADYLRIARALDDGATAAPFSRPNHAPPLAARPRRFSVTEIETLRRDPYAIYARKVLRLNPLDPLVRDPSAAERGTLFHAILHRFVASGVDPLTDDALERLLAAGREEFRNAALPADVEAVWWPRFAAMAPELVRWERSLGGGRSRRAEVRAEATSVGTTGVALSGIADRIDLLPAGHADILDYKTGSNPSKAQAHTLLAPQLALEGALLMRGAFREAGLRTPSQLSYVRLRANGKVEEESILKYGREERAAGDLSTEAWRRLERLLDHYNNAATGYLSRALPFREGDVGGDYDHLARVLEWSAGGDDGEAS